jgi:uncharacterized membrane protein (UPF0136 family)
MNFSIVAVFAYGILAIVGGIIGYMQANSTVSLISGLISGILLVFTGFFQLQGQGWATTLAAVVTSILVVVFAIRFAKTRKFMPAGLMVLLGIVTLVVNVSNR